jgi:hypothetical protein
MELLIQRLSGICLPGAPNPAKWARLIGGAVHRTTGRLAEAVRRAAPGVRLALYSAAGTTTGVLAAAAGMDLADAVSFGMNVAGTAAAFWSPFTPPRGGIGSEVR